MKKAVVTLTLLWAAGVAFATQGSTETATLKPILPLDADLHTLPFLELALRDPVIDMRAANLQDATSILAAAEKLESTLEGTKGRKARLKLVNEIFRNYLAIVAYNEDVDHFLIDDKRVGRGDAMRVKLAKYAAKLTVLTKDPDDRSQARYHVLVSKILGGKESEAFAEVAAATDERGGRQAANFELLRAMAELSGSEQEAGRARLTKVFPKLSAPGGILAMLLISRSLAGIDDKGSIYAEAKPDYKKYLIAATKRAAYMSESMRSEVFSYALGIWRTADGGTEDWEKPAIAMILLKDLDEGHAVEERLALRALDGGRFADAIQRYGRVIDSHKLQPEMARLTERVLDIHQMQAAKTKDVKAYGEALRVAERTFSNKDVLGKDHTKTAQTYSDKFRDRYRAYVVATLDQSLTKEATPAMRQASLQLAREYLGRARKEDEKTALNMKMAQVHMAAGEFDKAAEVYMYLSERTKGADGRKFLRLAIEAQSALAKWPATPPWSGAPAGDPKARLALADMYEELNEFTKSLDWSVLAHIGLLRSSAGQSAETYALWLGALKNSPRGEDASRAAGWLLTTARAGKKWGDLVYIVYQVQTHKIVPSVNGKDIDPSQYLADGLFNGGMAAFEKREFAAAVKFLDGLVKQFPRDSRYVEALFVRGKAQIAMEDVKNGLLSLREVLTEYRKSRYFRPAIQEGVKIAATDDDRVIFYEAYLNEFPKGENVPFVRGALADIYIKLFNYKGASRLLSDHAKDKRVKLEDRYASYAKIMDIEEKHGTMEKAQQASVALSALAKDDQGYMARVIAFQAREANRKKQFKKFESFEKRLVDFDSSRKEVSEALAQVRYFISVRDSEKALVKVDPLSIKDPIKEVQNRVSTYQAVRKNFERVCELSTGEYCQSAKQKLSDISLFSIDAIRDIRPPVTMDDKAVKGFETQKSQIVEIMSQTVAR